MTKPITKPGALGAALSKRRGRPPKNPQPPPASESPAPASSKTELPPEVGDVGIDVQNPPEEKGGLSLGSFLSLGKEDGGGEKPKRGRPLKKQPIKIDPDELARFLLIPALLAVGKKYIERAEARPTAEEAEGFTVPLACIIARHLPAVAASEDVIDLGRMLLAGMSWYMRIAALTAEAAEGTPSGAPGAKEAAPVDGKESPHEERSNGREEIRIVVPARARVGLFAGSS